MRSQSSLLADVDRDRGAEFKFGAPIFEFRFDCFYCLFWEDYFICVFVSVYGCEIVFEQYMCARDHLRWVWK